MSKLNALKRVPDFTGKEDVEQWLDRVEAAMRIDGVESKHHADVLVMRLDGAARKVWKNMPAEKQLDVVAIKSELQTAFGLQRYEAWLKATALAPISAGDSVDAAFNDIKALVSVA